MPRPGRTVAFLYGVLWDPFSHPSGIKGSYCENLIQFCISHNILVSTKQIVLKREKFLCK
jgi:hypothetical protein